MTHRITVAGSDIAFPCDADETILDAAERAGFAMPYSCRKGVCSSCKGGIVAGSVSVGRSGSATGPVEDVLLCVARPQGAIEIAPKRITAATRPTRKRLMATVHRIEWPAADVAIVQLRLPIGRRAPFRAGQYVRVLLGDGESRNYSLANAPHDNDGVTLHVRRVPGGRFSDRAMAALSPGDHLDLELPYGQFFLSEDDSTPTILIGTGTGFAPLASIIGDLARRRIHRPVHLFWGGRDLADLYQLDLARRWAATFPWLAFTPVLSRPGAGWTGSVGRVQQAVLAHHADLSQHEVYACGSATMIDDARATLIRERRLAEDNFYADAFVASGEAIPAP